MAKAVVLPCDVSVNLKWRACSGSMFFPERLGAAMRRGVEGEDCSRDMHSHVPWSALVALPISVIIVAMYYYCGPKADCKKLSLRCKLETPALVTFASQLSSVSLRFCFDLPLRTNYRH